MDETQVRDNLALKAGTDGSRDTSVASVNGYVVDLKAKAIGQAKQLTRGENMRETPRRLQLWSTLTRLSQGLHVIGTVSFTLAVI